MDFRKKVKRKNAVLLILMILLLASFIALFCMFGLKRRGMYKWGSAALLIIIYAYGLYKSKLINKLCDKDHDAHVIDCRFRIQIIPVGRAIRRVPVYDVTFKTDNGKKYVRTYKQERTSPKYYNVGAKVHHFRCTKFPLKYNHEPLEVICPMCGRNTKNDNLYYCSFCKVTFLDI